LLDPVCELQVERFGDQVLFPDTFESAQLRRLQRLLGVLIDVKIRILQMVVDGL